MKNTQTKKLLFTNSSQMNQHVEKKQTFVIDKIYYFKDDFTLTDKSMNDSTVSEIHLSIPNEKINEKKYNSKGKRYLSENQLEISNSNKNEIENEEIKVNNNNFSKNNMQTMKNNPYQNQQNPNAKENNNHQPNDIDEDKKESNITLVKENNIESIPAVSNHQEKSSSDSEYDFSEEQKIPLNTQQYFENIKLMPKSVEITKDNLYDCLSLGSSAVFYIHLDPKDKKNPKFISSLEKPNDMICNITRDRKIGAFSYKVLIDDDVIASVFSNFSHNSFYAISNQHVISAVSFKKRNKKLKIRQFHAFIPKENVNVPSTNPSSLLNPDLNISKIDMEPRPPKLKAGIPVLYFGGRVKKESTKNFILETKEDGCARLVFGKATDEMFVGEIYPPLSPIQAITIALSHFN